MRLLVVTLPKLHIAVGDRALCGLRVNAEMDGYADAVGLVAWNAPDADRCGLCERALSTNFAGRRRGRVTA